MDHTALQRVFLAEHGQMCYPAHPQALKVNSGNVTSFPLAFNPFSSVSNRRENEKQDKIKKKKRRQRENRRQKETLIKTCHLALAAIVLR